MTRTRLLQLAACVSALWLTTSPVHAQQYYGGIGNLSRFGGATGPRLSPYLNLLRGGDQASNYYLGVLPERERRFDESVFSNRIRNLEQRRAVSDPITRTGDDIIPPVPTAGAPIGSRTSASYFRQDGLGIGTHRSPRLR